MALAASRLRTQQLLAAVRQLRCFASVVESLAHDVAAAVVPEAAGPTKQMNYCTAVNDALHTAMRTDKKWAHVAARHDWAVFILIHCI
jgi:hypothetical protein